MKRTAAMASSARPSDETPVRDDASEPAKTVAEAVYRRFRRDILLGKLAPGAPLRSNDLRRDYDVGISPLREALSRLVSEELVTLSGQKGFRVAPVSIEDILDTMETRIVIDSEAISRSIRSGGLDWETAVVSSFHTLSKVSLPTSGGEDAENWAMRHRKFHMALVSGCQSRWMIKLSGALFDHAERHRIIGLMNITKRQSAEDEHRRIMDAALAGNVKATVAAIDYHYRSTAELVVQSLGDLATNPAVNNS